MTVTVHPPASDGRYRVDVAGLQMVEGSSWNMLVQRGRGYKQFERRATDGTWSLKLHLNANRDEGAFVIAEAVGGPREHGCVVLNLSLEGGTYLSGATACTSSRLMFTDTWQSDDTAVVTTSIFDNKPAARWGVHLTASRGTTSQSVWFDGMTDRRGVLRSRVDLRGVERPRVRVNATRSDGRHCNIRVYPSNVAASDMPAPQRAQQLTAQARHSMFRFLDKS